MIQIKWIGLAIVCAAMMSIEGWIIPAYAGADMPAVTTPPDSFFDMVTNRSRHSDLSRLLHEIHRRKGHACRGCRGRIRSRTAARV